MSYNVITQDKTRQYKTRQDKTRHDKTIQDTRMKSKDVTRQKNKPFRVDEDLRGGGTFSFADMLSAVGITTTSSDGVSAGFLAGELCCEVSFAGELGCEFEVSFAGDLTCVTREVSFAGELGCEFEPACSFSARRLLRLPWTIAPAASLGVLSLGILVTAGERRQ